MDLSIIIVSFNTKELLSQSLRSIKKSIKNLKAEIFVVDNNSHDGTAYMVKKSFPEVHLIENKQNFGFSKANNQALKIAKGKYILVLNPDTKLLPDTLTKMVKWMGNSPEDVAMATCKVTLPDGHLDRDCRRSFPTPFRSLTHFSGLSKLFPRSKIFDQYYLGYLDENKEYQIDACVGAFMMVKSEAIKKVGEFDEDFFFYGEDLDWCWRFKEAGYKIFYTPQTKIIHYKGAASGMKKSSKHLSKATTESKKKALRESTRAMSVFYEKHLKQNYPFFVNWPVIFGIKLLGQIRILRVQV